MSSMFKSKSITAKVGDTDVEFFSLSFPVLFAMKSAVGPVAKVLSSLFSSNRNLVGRFQEDTKDTQGSPVRVVQEQAMTPEMAKLRAEQSTKTVQEATEALFADQNRMLIGRILMDSMRGICPRKPTPVQIEEFLAELDLGQVMEMIQGVLRANAEVFGPLGRDLGQKATALLRAQASSESPISPEQTSNGESSVQPVPRGPQLVPKD